MFTPPSEIKLVLVLGVRNNTTTDRDEQYVDMVELFL